MKPITSRKSTPKNLSEQVLEILQNAGLSNSFNYSDYTHFKRQAKNAFNKAQTIANFFISENQENSDFNQYIF